KLAHDTRAATSQIGSTLGELTREASAVTAEIKTGVERSRAAQSGFGTLSDTVREVSEIVGMVDRQTEGIAHSTSMIQTSVDRVYQIVEGTNPVQYNVRFNEAADRLVRPILDRTKGSDNRIIGSAIGDTNGYLPTHLTERSHPQGPDPVWNDEHCRNKRILIDDTTRMALASEKPAMLATYRMELGDKFIPVKNVFVPLWIKGRRWGNFELAYRDD